MEPGTELGMAGEEGAWTPSFLYAPYSKEDL